MSRIDFDKKNYVEIRRSIKDKIDIIISAENSLNPAKTIINSVSLSEEQFKSLIKGIE